MPTFYVCHIQNGTTRFPQPACNSIMRSHWCWWRQIWASSPWCVGMWQHLITLFALLLKKKMSSSAKTVAASTLISLVALFTSLHQPHTHFTNDSNADWSSHTPTGVTKTKSKSWEVFNVNQQDMRLEITPIQLPRKVKGGLVLKSVCVTWLQEGC